MSKTIDPSAEPDVPAASVKKGGEKVVAANRVVGGMPEVAMRRRMAAMRTRSRPSGSKPPAKADDDEDGPPPLPAPPPAAAAQPAKRARDAAAAGGNANPYEDVALLLEAAPLPLRVVGMPTGDSPHWANWLGADEPYGDGGPIPEGQKNDFEKALRSRLDGLLVGGAAEEATQTEWTMSELPEPNDFEGRRQQQRHLAREDAKKVKAAETMQAHARGMNARAEYREMKPQRAWRFVKTHRRMVTVTRDGGGNHSTVFMVQKHERLDLISASGSGRLLLHAQTTDGAVLVNGSNVYDSSLHALQAASPRSRKKRNGPPICSAPGEHLYTFTVEPLSGTDTARLDLTFHMESAFTQEDLLSEPPPANHADYLDPVRRPKVVEPAYAPSATEPMPAAKTAMDIRREQLMGYEPVPEASAYPGMTYDAASLMPNVGNDMFARASEVEWQMSQEERIRGQAHLAQIDQRQQAQFAAVGPQSPRGAQPAPPGGRRQRARRRPRRLRRRRSPTRRRFKQCTRRIRTRGGPRTSRIRRRTVGLATPRRRSRRPRCSTRSTFRRRPRNSSKRRVVVRRRRRSRHRRSSRRARPVGVAAAATGRRGAEEEVEGVGGECVRPNRWR